MLKPTKRTEFANSNNGSRKCANNIAIIIICLWAMLVGIGCISLKDAKSFEIDSPFVDIEYEAKQNGNNGN